jgi:hypothetical protein
MSITQRAELGTNHSFVPPEMSSDQRDEAVAEPEHGRDTQVDIEVEFALELGVWDPPSDGLRELGPLDARDDEDGRGDEQVLGARERGGSP